MTNTTNNNTNNNTATEFVWTPYSLETDKNGKRPLAVELLATLKTANRPEAFAAFGKKEFAELCKTEYHSSTGDPNGFVQALRGFAIGYGFEWKDERKQGVTAALKAENARQAEELEQLRRELAALKATKKQK